MHEDTESDEQILERYMKIQQARGGLIILGIALLALIFGIAGLVGLSMSIRAKESVDRLDGQVEMLDNRTNEFEDGFELFMTRWEADRLDDDDDRAKIIRNQIYTTDGLFILMEKAGVENPPAPPQGVPAQ